MNILHYKNLICILQYVICIVLGPLYTLLPAISGAKLNLILNEAMKSYHFQKYGVIKFVVHFSLMIFCKAFFVILEKLYIVLFN